MALHLLKLCVGAQTIEDLERWIARRRSEGEPSPGDEGAVHGHVHTTRMTPKRMQELLEGGSLYWVIKGNVQARQKLVAIQPFTDAEGVSRCRLVMEPKLHRTRWQPRRPFQGWRYLKPDDAPPDLGDGDGDVMALPADLRRELAQLGLL